MTPTPLNYSIQPSLKGVSTPPLPLPGGPAGAWLQPARESLIVLKAIQMPTCFRTHVRIDLGCKADKSRAKTSQIRAPGASKSLLERKLLVKLLPAPFLAHIERVWASYCPCFLLACVAIAVLSCWASAGAGKRSCPAGFIFASLIS